MAASFWSIAVGLTPWHFGHEIRPGGGVRYHEHVLDELMETVYGKQTLFDLALGAAASLAPANIASSSANFKSHEEPLWELLGERLQFSEE